MLRAARFASQLGFTLAPEVVAAMTAMAGRSRSDHRRAGAGRAVKLLLGAHPRRGLELLVDTGLADVVLPELPALRLEIDEHHRHKDVYEHTLTVLEQAIALEDGRPARPRAAARRAAARRGQAGDPAARAAAAGSRFHHHEVVGAKLARSRLKALRFPKDVIEDVARLVVLHLRFHGYGRGEWTDSAVRRYVRDAGPLLARLHKLTRSDCTTRNRRKAGRAGRRYDALEERIARLAAEEELAAIRPDLDGNEIMELLGMPPGPLVGRPGAPAGAAAGPRPAGRTTRPWPSCGAGRPSGALPARRSVSRARAGGGRGRRPASGGDRRLPGRLPPGEPGGRPRSRVPAGAHREHRVRLAGRRQRERGRPPGRRDERDVEQRVVEGEDPAAEVVLDLYLDRVSTLDLGALGDHPEQRAPPARSVCMTGTRAPSSVTRRAAANSPVTQRRLADRRTAAG